MKLKTPLKLLLWLFIGIICFFLIEAIVGEVVSATDKKVDSNDEMVSFYWLIVIIGGIIASTLSYVSWRKYKGEKEIRQVSDNDKSID